MQATWAILLEQFYVWLARLACDRHHYPGLSVQISIANISENVFGVVVHGGDYHGNYSRSSPLLYHVCASIISHTHRHAHTHTHTHTHTQSDIFVCLQNLSVSVVTLLRTDFMLLSVKVTLHKEHFCLFAFYLKFIVLITTCRFDFHDLASAFPLQYHPSSRNC